MNRNATGIKLTGTEVSWRNFEFVRRGFSVAMLFGVFLMLVLIPARTTLGAARPDNTHEQIVKIVARIQRSDYEGDRAALKQLHAELAPFVENKEFGTRVRYWRGFALWRRAINGFNEPDTPTDLETDLKDAVTEFHEAGLRDPAFADAKIAEASCLGYIGYIHRKEPTQIQTLIAQIRPLLQEVEASAPDNPRLHWVLGPVLWNTPVERGGGQAKTFENYEKGLEAVRKHKGISSDPLEPSWGEAELLMNLAWSNLNRTTPDLNAAEQYAQSALKLVPYWHYVKDILLPKIQEAKNLKEPAKEPKSS